MSTILKTKFSRLTLNTKGIIDLIDISELIRRKDAAKYAARVMKKNVGRKGGRSRSGGFPKKRSGRNYRAVGLRLLKNDRSAVVGSRDPKAHLLEFGHGDGKEINKRPFVYRSLAQAEPKIIEIMSKPYKLDV